MGDQGTTSLNNLPSDNVYEPNANIVMETTNIQNQQQMQPQMQQQQKGTVFDRLYDTRSYTGVYQSIKRRIDSYWIHFSKVHFTDRIQHF